MQEDPLTESQSETMVGDETGQFHGTYKYILNLLSQYLPFITILFIECPNGHKTFIGNVSLTAYTNDIVIYCMILIVWTNTPHWCV